jgi:protein required for attachment to host cells
MREQLRDLPQQTRKNSMSDYCVVVVDGARARFFTLEPANLPEMESSPNLVEQTTLVNMEKEAKDRDLLSDTKSGRNRGSSGGGAHGYDDHRAQHGDEVERRFARLIADEAMSQLDSHSPSRVVLVAEKRMLGFLRAALDAVVKTGVAVEELAKDLGKLTNLQVHEHLAKDGLVPRRRNPAA